MSGLRKLDEEYSSETLATMSQANTRNCGPDPLMFSADGRKMVAALWLGISVGLARVKESITYTPDGFDVVRI